MFIKMLKYLKIFIGQKALKLKERERKYDGKINKKN